VGSRNEATDRGCFRHEAGRHYRDRPEGSRGMSCSQARQQKLRIGSIEAKFSRRRLAPGDERYQRLSAGGPFPSNPPKRQNPSRRPPHGGAAFRIRLADRCATAAGTEAKATSASASLDPILLFSAANATNAKLIALLKNRELVVSRPCAETSVDRLAKGRAQQRPS
jgi:hypothetical protein